MSMEKGIAGGNIARDFMLFGVRVVVDSIRKSVSLNNLSQYEQHRLHSSSNSPSNSAVIVAYASADEAVRAGGRERKRGTPWTEEEHKLFLIGLQKVGKGGWRGIARNFVKSRTPTQVASHAQKYFLRRSNLNRRRRRSSLFDITTDTVAATDPMDDVVDQSLPLPAAQSQQSKQPISNSNPIYLASKKWVADIDLNKKSLNDSSSFLSLNLSLSTSSSNSANSSSKKHSGIHAMQGFRNEDNMITVV